MALLIASCGQGTIGDSKGSGAAGSGSGPTPGSAAPGSFAPGSSLPLANISGPVLPTANLVRRLTRAEIDNTLRDLLGDSTHPSSKFLQEDVFTPYDNDFTLQQASTALIESISVMAEDVAQRFLSDADRHARVVPCTPSGPSDTDCLRKTVDSFGKRAFRRPLSADEVDSYMSLGAFATDPGAGPSDFYRAASLVVRSVVSDPEFLYRIEAAAGSGGSTGQLDDYEIASRMSYLLWGSAPDDALLAEASRGALKTPEGRRSSAERLLQDARAREQIHRFHAMWLGYRTIPHPADVAAEFQKESEALIDRAVFEPGRSYLDLFLSRETFIDPSLSQHYGLPLPAGGSGWVPYADPQRAGILAHASVLAAFSKFTDTSPTQRGILVRTRLMCETIPPPPAVVNVDQPPTSMTSPCKRDRYAEHSQSAGCVGCHSRMDPIGFGLERYDVAGKLRDHDDGHPECPIDGLGNLPELGAFSGPLELEKKLVDAGVLDACTISQYLTFARGRAPIDEDAPEVAAYLTSFRAGQFSMTQLISDFIAGDAFSKRRESGVP